MPKDNIERAIAKGTGADSDADAFEAVVYEGYGPGGVAVLVEALTDNRNRTGSEVRHAFTKSGGNLGEPGSVAWIFEKKGELVVDGEPLLRGRPDGGHRRRRRGRDARRGRVRGGHRARPTSPPCATALEAAGVELESAELVHAAHHPHAGGGGRRPGSLMRLIDDARGARRRAGRPRELRRGRRGARARGRGLSAGGRRPARAAESPAMVVVLGIDPGTANTGYGVVLSRGARWPRSTAA